MMSIRGDKTRQPHSFLWDLVTFKVEERMFRIDCQELVKASPIFATMLSLPAGDRITVEGQSDENPIVLEGYKADDFESLLKLIYPTFDDLVNGDVPLTKTQWVGVLNLSTRWEMNKIRNYAIDTLSRFMGLTPLEKIDLARSYKVASLLEEGLTSLARGPELPMDDIEASLGLRTAFRILGIRAKLSQATPLRPVAVPNGPPCLGVSFACIKCPLCKDHLFGDARECDSCRRAITSTEAGQIYVEIPGERSLQVDAEKVFLLVNLLEFWCGSCKKRAFLLSVNCTSCSQSVHLAIRTTVLFASRSTHRAEDLVREVFEDELKEYCI